jgi:hypothetical protein
VTTSANARTLSVYIDRPLGEVYAFVAVPENFPRWASGLGSSLAHVNDEGIAKTPQGPARIRFSAPDGFGVLDHSAMPAAGGEVYMPMRCANCSGAGRLPPWMTSARRCWRSSRTTITP